MHTKMVNLSANAGILQKHVRSSKNLELVSFPEHAGSRRQHHVCFDQRAHAEQHRVRQVVNLASGLNR